LEFGKKVRSVINTVIDLKDELIVVAAVIGTVFVVSKIAAAVSATIALIKTLIVAYNLLKASALVAGVASAFALNPLLGVGAVALAAGVLAAANALANQSTGQTTFAVGGAPGAISGGTTPGTISPSGSSGGGGISTAASSAAAATTAITGAANDAKNAARLTAQGSGAFNDAQNQARLVTVNVNAPSIIDEEAFSRAIIDALNNSTFRGTNGASNLIGTG